MSQILEFVTRCTQAFHRIKQDQPNNHEAACAAFLAALPILTDPAAFQAYFACLGQALTLGVIDLIDLGRYCHLAQMAMSAWKLAHPALPAAKKTALPTPPKGNHFAQEDDQQPDQQPFGDPQNSLPTPTEGNLSEEEANRRAASHLPDVETQHALYKSLRQRRIQLPSNSHLRKNPIEALYFCSLAKTYLTDQSPDTIQATKTAA